jgi:hypothetical protein
MTWIWFQDMGHLKDYIKTNKKQSPKAEVQNSLKQEVWKRIFFFITMF